ncbi:helix-turn-helix domain-containing protein [Sphingomonas sp. QA11]|nr:helix-turn-helix domain-containing protein [Sphingomonas sp. QA11]
MSLVEVDIASGYVDQAHMIRFFKRFAATPPGRFRRDNS